MRARRRREARAAAPTALVATLATVSRVVSSRGSVQVLSGVLLRPDGDRLELAATDMELSLRTTLAAKVEGDNNGATGKHPPSNTVPRSRVLCGCFLLYLLTEFSHGVLYSCLTSVVQSSMVQS